MPSLTSELFVRLIDGVTKPAAAVSRSLLGIERAAAGANGKSLGTRIAEASARNAAQLDVMRGKMVDAAAAGYLLARGLAAPINSAVNFETQLEDIGQKADIPQERLAALGQKIRQVGIQTNQAASEIAKSVDTMVGMGASEQVALAAAAPIGQAATAYRAATEDLAAASYAAVENLKVPTDQIGTAIDMMAEAGKQGAFELRDMAKYFPALGAAYQGLGQKGTSSVADLAAALQVVRKGTGDAASAATNLNNVLQKIYAPATVKSFKKMGIDIRKEMKKAAKEGKTPIEAIAEITNKALKGDLSKLGNLFEDAQVQQGLRALIQNMDEYRKIRADALKAQGVVAKDFERRMNNSSQAIARFSAMIENLSVSVGSALLPALNDTVAAVSPLIIGMTNFAEQNPEVTRNIVAAATALIGLKVATTGAKWAFLFLRGGVLDVVGPLVRMAEAGATAARSSIALQKALAGGQAYGTLAKMGTAFRAIALAVPGVSAAAGAIGAVGAAITGPVVVAVAAIAAAGFTIYKYWDRISSIFSGVASAIGEELAPAFQAARPYLTWLEPLGSAIAAGWEKAKSALSAFGEWMGTFFQQEVLSEDQKAQWATAGHDAAVRMIEAVKQAFSDLVAWASDLGSRIGSAIANSASNALSALKAKVTGLFSFGGGTPAPAGGPAPEARAKGGPVRRGRHYIVGDGGEPEFFSPGADGFITPMSKASQNSARAGGGGRSRGGPAGGVTFAPVLKIGKVVGVEDLEARLAAFQQRIRDDFDAQMAGTFSDQGTA